MIAFQVILLIAVIVLTGALVHFYTKSQVKNFSFWFQCSLLSSGIVLSSILQIQIGLLH